MRARAWTRVSASCFTTVESACTTCKAMRSAERGPIPGSLFSAAIRETTGSGIGFIARPHPRSRPRPRFVFGILDYEDEDDAGLAESRQAQTRSNLAHLRV